MKLFLKLTHFQFSPFFVRVSNQISKLSIYGINFFATVTMTLLVPLFLVLLMFIIEKSLGLKATHVHVTGKIGDFPMAQMVCEKLGMKVIRIRNEKDNIVVVLIVAVMGGGHFWVDANNLLDGKWLNSDNNNLTFFNWRDSEPNNWIGKEHCIEVNLEKWNNIGCDREKEIDYAIVIIKLFVIGQGLCMVCNDIILLVIGRGLDAEIVIRKVHRVTTAQIVDKKGIDPLRLVLDEKLSMFTAHHEITSSTSDLRKFRNCVNHLIKIYSKISEYISIILVFVSNQFNFI